MWWLVEGHTKDARRLWREERHLDAQTKREHV